MKYILIGNQVLTYWGKILRLRFYGEDQKFEITWTIKIAVGLTVLFSSLLLVDPGKILELAEEKKDNIALVLFRSNDVKVKHAGSPYWVLLKRMDPLFADSMVFTGDDSFAKILFRDGTAVSVGKNSLLKIRAGKKKETVKEGEEASATVDRAPEGPVSIELEGGNIDVDTSKSTEFSGIKTGDSEIKVEEGSQLSLASSSGGGTQMKMEKGKASLAKAGTTETQEVKAGEEVSTTEEEFNEEEQVDEKDLEKYFGTMSGESEQYEMKRKGFWETIRQLFEILF